MIGGYVKYRHPIFPLPLDIIKGMRRREAGMMRNAMLNVTGYQLDGGKVCERDDEFIVLIDMGDVEKETISATYEDGMVSVTGKTPEGNRIFKSVFVPGADEEVVLKGSNVSGVLVIHLPKKIRVKKIVIE